MSGDRYVTDELALGLDDGEVLVGAGGHPGPQAARSFTYTAEAACHDCEWTGGGAGVLGRAAQHHDRTGHEVGVTTTTTYQRRGAPPGQPELEGLET